MSRHFQDDINAQTVRDFQDLLDGINFTGIEDVVRAHLRGDFETFGIGFDGKNGTGTRYAAQSNRPQADGSAAKDGYGFVRNFASKRGVNGITKGFLNGGNAMVYFFACLPGNFFRNSDVLCKRSIAINAQDLHVPANVGLPGLALVALTAGNMCLGRYKVS